MKLKKLWVLLPVLLTAVFFSGCLAWDDAPGGESQITPYLSVLEETGLSEEITPPKETALQEEAPPTEETVLAEETAPVEISEEGEYSSPEEVAKYLQMFGKLPSNYVTKKEAKNAGWNSADGNLWEVLPGKSIGGDRFGNREGLLPDKDGRVWYECDVNYSGGFRGAERILYSSDGLIYYTGDHYQSFEPIGEES